MRKLFLLLALIPVTAGAAPQIVRSFDAPDTGITGLACSGGSDLYAVSGPSHKLFKINPVTGAVIDSWTLAPTNLNGLGMAGGSLFVTNGTSTVYNYNTSGTLIDTSIIMCSG
ncbi:hypothetical protein GX411_01755 [Candidatus Fermentibacteria bacterium]|nr:hypothetical protein [Candidatus Fermentibacteria bacterium]